MLMRWLLGNEDMENGLFVLGETICDECPRKAVGYFDPEDDEFFTALCARHLADNVSALASDLIREDLQARGQWVKVEG